MADSLIILGTLFVMGYVFWLLLLRPILWICAKRSMKRKVVQNIEEHLDTLVRKRAQTLGTDDYGNVLSQKWQKEVEYFLLKVVVPLLNRREQRALSNNPNYVANEIIEKNVREAHIKKSEALEFSESMSPRDFEYFCANELRKIGWKAELTKGSGEQGVDIIAEKDGLRIVLQCKKYSKPVGNKAVQEIIAGKSYETAKAACVVSNAAYTKSARELATTTGVHLLHYLDLEDIDNIIWSNPR